MSKTDAMDMALDEIIAQKKTQKKGNRNRKPQGNDKPKPAIASATDKLVVSNLAPSVSQSDVRELFARIGPVRSAQLNYNQDGKSKGVATVIFSKLGDAHKAYTEYHNRPLDNRPMKIELIINPDVPQIRKLNSTARSGGIQKKGRGGGRSGRPKREPKKELTATDLDADMDAYMSGTGNDTNALADAMA